MAVIGEEGDGKSTLLKWIYNPDMVTNYVEVTGKRILSNERLAYLPQELPANYKNASVFSYFTELDNFFDIGYDDLRNMAHVACFEPDFFFSNQKIGTLSGGERIKIQILRLLMTQPTVLLLDEPSNDIDLSTMEWLGNLIREWKGIVLFVSHDETLIEQSANVIIHLEMVYSKKESRWGVFRMSYPEYKNRRAQEFHKQEQQAVWERRKKQIRDEKLHRIEQSVKYAQATISRGDPHGGQLLKKKMHAVKSMERRFEKADANMIKMPIQESAINLKLNSNVVSIPAGKIVLNLQLPYLCPPDSQRILSKKIHLVVHGNEKVCIIGTNGAGKTTLLRIINSTLSSRRDIRIGYMPQDYEEELNLSMSPIDFLDETGSMEERTAIRTLLGSLRYTTAEMNHCVANLSGGQKAKLLMLKMIRNGYNVLLLDEPTRNFSPLSSAVIRNLLRDFPGVIISVSHDRKYISETCNKVYHLTTEGLFSTGEYD